jgi:2-haloacid dehalogenase
MATATFPGIRACVFDAYGTIFDFNSAAARCRDALGDKATSVSALWRDKQIQYTWLRSLMGRHADFWQVTGEALDYVLDALDVRTPGIKERLLDCYLTLDCFPEVPELLKRLKAEGLKTAILSNGSPKMLAAAVAGAKLGPLLDAVLSVEEVGIFKPDMRIYRLAADRLGLAPSAISFQSSNAWDAHGAGVFGFKVAWCNRYGQRPERLPGKPDAEIRTLAELPALLGL